MSGRGVGRKPGGPSEGSRAPQRLFPGRQGRGAHNGRRFRTDLAHSTSSKKCESSTRDLPGSLVSEENKGRGDKRERIKSAKEEENEVDDKARNKSLSPKRPKRQNKSTSKSEVGTDMSSDEERRDTDSEEVKRDISKEIEKMWVYKNTGIEDNNKKVSTGRTYADVLRENKKTIFKKSERGTKYSTGSSATMVKVMAQEGSKYLPTDYSETNLMYHLHHSKVIHSLDVKTIKYNLKNNWVTMKVTKTQEITKNTLDVFKRGEIQNISSKNVLWWVEEIVPNTWVTISGVPLGAAPDEVK